ncbi:MAG: hypothetical protein IK077_16320 [Thermoguttaceae bacterium]|nr:hypothetical protein [Thermoguttaceae bacterium]
MKFHMLKSASTFGALLSVVVLTAFAAYGSEAEMKEIEARAEKIAPMLAEAPNFGARAAGQDVWDRLAQSPSAKSMIRSAEGLLKQDMPVLTEDLYKEYFVNGNRSHYQSQFGAVNRRIEVFTLAEKFENKGRFVDALNEAILYFCDQPSWLLPAHDRNAVVYDQKDVYSDLGATLASGNLAISINLLADKLPAETVERARAEIERRILKPYRDAVAGGDFMSVAQRLEEKLPAGIVDKVKQEAARRLALKAKAPVFEKVAENVNAGMWWVRGTNNWNAVCHAGTVASALNVVESREERAFYLAAADYFSETRFMIGFTEDGYCSEGMGYWNYGVGNYMLLGALARVATNGQLDMFRFPKMRAVLDYAPNLEIDKGNYAVFADCSMTAKASALYVGYLSRLKGWGYETFERAGLGSNFGFGDPMDVVSFGFDADVTFAETSGEPKPFKLPIRTEFPNAGVMICRPDPSATGRYFAAAFKGGDNNEMHNHNDVGSYSLLMGDASDPKAADVFLSRDPGGETYTARTFGSRRYEGQLLNSYGHPVPRIAGKLQDPGAKSKGVVIEKNLTDEKDVFAIDFKSCYNVPTLQKLTRQFEFVRARDAESGSFTITDSVAFEEGKSETFETAMITFEKFEIQENDGALTIKFADAQVDVSATDANGAKLNLVAETTIVGENDESVPNKPTRIALRVDGPVNSAVVAQVFAVAK